MTETPLDVLTRWGLDQHEPFCVPARECTCRHQVYRDIAALAQPSVEPDDSGPVAYRAGWEDGLAVGVRDERARIGMAVEGLPRQVNHRLDDQVERAAVLALIAGDES